MNTARAGAAVASARLSALVMLLHLAALSGCTPGTPAAAVRSSETIIGRAAWQGRVVMLTDAPALISIDPAAFALTRTELSADGVPADRLWGLAEQDGRLFTIAAFFTLVEVVTTDGKARLVKVAALQRPVANLIDLDAGMGAQPVDSTAGAPLLETLDLRGRLHPYPSPLRAAIGLTPGEENLMHLLSCSLPPDPVCWLPADPRLFEASEHALTGGPSLSVSMAGDAAQIAALTSRRVFDDILRAADGGFIVLHVEEGGAQRLSRFGPDGARVTGIAPAEPLRLLVAATAGKVVALTRNGRIAALDL